MDEFNGLTEAMFDYCCCGDEERVLRKKFERSNERTLIRGWCWVQGEVYKEVRDGNGGVRMFILQKDDFYGGHSPPNPRRCT
jgi:hypothetical protein